jgi:hypothetical protein
MANPAYPPQMQPQGMPGRPVPGGGGIPLAGTMRKGTPKAVPIVVSAGLAVGVFCGLYFGLGTGQAAEAETDATGSAKSTGPTGPKSAAGATGEVTNFASGTQPDAAPSDAAPAVVAGTGSGSAATPGTGSGSATPGTGSGSAMPGTGSGSAVPAAITVELTFAITPTNAQVTIDGKPVTDGKATISFTGDKKTIRLIAKASGHRSYDKKITLTKDTAEESIEIKLPKRSSSGSSRPPRGGNDRDPPGGLIDL